MKVRTERKEKKLSRVTEVLNGLPGRAVMVYLIKKLPREFGKLLVNYIQNKHGGLLKIMRISWWICKYHA